MNVDRKQLEDLGWSADLIDEVLRQGALIEDHLPDMGHLPPLPDDDEDISEAGASVEVTYDSLVSSSGSLIV